MSAVVIGAKGSIGSACVRQLVPSHADVFALDLGESAIPGATSVAVDVTDPSSVRSALDEVESTSPIEALIYAAGLNTTGYVEGADWDDYHRVMDVNLRGAFVVGADMQRRIRGNPRTCAFVFISSTAGLVGEAGGTIYCASKFGLRGFAQSFAAEIAQWNCRANSVCPGNVDSPMLSLLADQIGERSGRSGQQILDELAASTSFNRLITIDEVAKTCAWLVSPDSSGISGQTIVVDGPPPA